MKNCQKRISDIDFKEREIEGTFLQIQNIILYEVEKE